ncbi:hypothetical protein LXL04_038548 [Taraxacum kok-saghyz]
MITNVTFVGQGFTRKPPMYERSLIIQSNSYYPQSRTHFCLIAYLFGQKYTPNSNSRTRESRTTAAAQQDLQAPKAGAEWSKTTPKDEQQKQERAEQQQQHSRTSKHSRQGQKGQKLPPKTEPTTTAPRFITIKAVSVHALD